MVIIVDYVVYQQMTVVWSMVEIVVSLVVAEVVSTLEHVNVG